MSSSRAVFTRTITSCSLLASSECVVCGVWCVVCVHVCMCVIIQSSVHEDHY